MRCAICRTPFDVAAPPSEESDGQQSSDVAQVVFTVVPLLVLIGIFATGLKATVLHGRRVAREAELAEASVPAPEGRGFPTAGFGQTPVRSGPPQSQPDERPRPTQSDPSSIPAMPPTMASVLGDTPTDAASQKLQEQQRQGAVDVSIRWLDTLPPGAPKRTNPAVLRAMLFGEGDLPAQFVMVGGRVAGLQATSHKITLTRFPQASRQTIVDATDLTLSAFAHRSIEDARVAPGKFRCTTLAGTADGRVYQWDRGRRTSVTGQHDSAVMGVWYRSADVLSVSFRGQVLVHSDPEQVPQQVQFPRRERIVCTAAGAPLIGRADGSVLLLDGVPGREARGIRFSTPVYSLATSWGMIAIGGEDLVEIRGRLGLEKQKHWQIPGMKIVAVAISDDQRLLAVAGSRQDVLLYSLETDQLLQQWRLAAVAGSLAFSANNGLIVETSEDRFETLTLDSAAAAGANLRQEPRTP
ncbi:MAG: hypothetical protein NXI04_22510 [Planctomycetaceae bacterium]|nr:hypothetical protein [Planctomycetaceae bacterium]